MGLGYFCCPCIAPPLLERHECDNASQPDVELALLEDLKMVNILVGPCPGEGVGSSPVRQACTEPYLLIERQNPRLSHGTH